MHIEEGDEQVNAGPHPVKGSTLGSRAGWRIFWGIGVDDVHLSEDAMLTDAQMESAATAATVSPLAFRNALPAGAVRDFYDGLPGTKQLQVREGCAALDGVTLT